MARYKVSNKNIYGLKSGDLQTFVICVPLIIVLALICAFWIAPLFYPLYAEKYTLDQGAVGQVSTADTPLAASIADMERLTDGFTFYTNGTVLNHDAVRVGDEKYHWITLDSGEKVFARINQKALTDTGEIGIYRLPVGVWREWTPPEEMQYFTMMTDLDHYIDMYGEYVPVLSPADFGQAVGRILVLVTFRVVGVRTWRFAPALFASRDPLLPRNDLECWCAATYAIWSHAFDGMEGFPLITGTRGTRKQVKFLRSGLEDQWGIYNREQGLAMVHELTDRWAGRLDPRESGWDLCRATQLLAMMYLVKMIGRDELDREFSRAGRVIQRSFTSWDALVESYLAGFRTWISGTRYDPEHNVRFRRGIYERMKRQYFSPYSIPWNTDLSWVPGVSGCEREATKKLLKHYRGDY